MKPALTERQQLAIVMQMTTPQKQEGSRVETPVTPGSSGKGKLHRRNERGETPLHSASIKGDMTAVEALLEQGADINSVDNAGWTPLHEAANHGHVEVVLYLLENGANINALGMEGDTPLHDAVGNDHYSVAKVLLEQGADPHQPNDTGKTPIDLARNNVNRAVYILLTDGESLPMETSSIELTPKAKVTHRKRRTSQELLLSSAIVSIPLPPDSKFFQKNGMPCPEPVKEPTEAKPPVSRPDTLTKSHADYLYSDISSSDDLEFSSPLFVSVDKKIMSGALTKQPLSDVVKYSDVSSPSDNSPATSNKLKGVTVPNAAAASTPELPVVGAIEGTTEPQSVQPVDTTPAVDADNDAVFVESVTTCDDQSPEVSVDGDESVDKESTHEDVCIKSVENDATDTADEEAPVAHGVMAAQDTTESISSVSSSKETTPPTDSNVECEEPLPDCKPMFVEEKKSLTVTEDDPSVEREDKTKENPLNSSEVVPKSPIKVNDRTIKLTTSAGTKLVSAVSDKLVTVPSTTKSQGLLVKPITKPYQAPELQKLTTPFTIATSSFKTGGVDNKLPKSGIITKSLFLPSPTKGNCHTIGSSNKPQNSRSSPVRSSSLVRTTNIIVPKAVPTMASSGNNKLTLSTVTTKASAVKPVANGSALTKATTLSGISKPFQVNGPSKVLTVTAPRTLTAPMVSRTLVVSSSAVKLSNSLTASKQESAGVKLVHQVQKAPVTSVVTTSIAVPATTVASTSIAASIPPTTTKTEVSHHPKHSTEPTSNSKVSTTADVLNRTTQPPPKKKPDKLVRSSVVEKRRQSLPTKELVLPECMSTFLMCTGDHGNNNKLNTEPQDVSPPIPPDMHSLFRQQQDERNDLTTYHTIELERLQLSMEQELVRLYQQHCGRGTPPSACDALLEQLLPYWYTTDRSHDPTPVSVTSEGDIEDLVKEVWKKFYNIKVSMVRRHKCEAEALHATQKVMWSGRLLSLGTSNKDASFRNISSAHVPLVQ